jgi:hypothetical protein
VSVPNLTKIITQEEPYVIIRLVGIVQCQRGMNIGERSGIESLGEMPLWPTNDKDENCKVIFLYEEGDDLEDFTLSSRSVAFIEAVDNDKASGICMIEIPHADQLAKRLDNQGDGLRFKGSSEDERVALNGSGHLPPCSGDVDRDLVCNCSDEGFGVTTCGIGAREEEAGKQKVIQITELCDLSGDGGFPGSSRPIEPENNGFAVLFPTTTYPIDYFLDDSGSGVGMTLG